MYNDKGIDKSLILRALTAISMTEKPGFRVYTLINEALYDTYHDNPQWQGFFTTRHNQIRNEHRYFYWAVETVDGDVHYYMYCTPDTYTRKHLHSMLYNRKLTDSDDKYRILVLGEEEYIIRHTDNIGLDMPCDGWKEYNTNTMMSKYVNDLSQVLRIQMSYIGKGITSKISKDNRKKIKNWLKRNAGSTSYPKKWSKDEIELAKELQSKLDNTHIPHIQHKHKEEVHMTLKEVTELYKGEYDDVDVVVDRYSPRSGFHCDYVNIIADGEYSDDDEAVEWSLMDKDEYSSTMLADACVAWSDIYDDDDKVLVVKVLHP